MPSLKELYEAAKRSQKAKRTRKAEKKPTKSAAAAHASANPRARRPGEDFAHHMARLRKMDGR